MNPLGLCDHYLMLIENWFGFYQGTYGKAESKIIEGISGHTLADPGLKRLIFVAGVELVGSDWRIR